MQCPPSRVAFVSSSHTRYAFTPFNCDSNYNKYDSSAFNLTIKNLWLIIYSAHMLISCPFATLMANTLDSRLWTASELTSSLRCYSCYHNVVNHWAPCIRRSSQINLHPSLTSRCRQMWFLIMQLLKFCETSPDFESDEEFKFLGENSLRYHTYRPTDADRRNLLPVIPRRLQTSKIVAKGIYLSKQLTGSSTTVIF